MYRGDIYIMPEQGFWTCRFENDPEATKLGMEIVPTPYKDTVPYEMVRYQIAMANPDHCVY